MYYLPLSLIQFSRGNIAASYTCETTNAVDWRVVPSDQYYYGTANQTVFIQGFKIAIREGILSTKRVRVKVDSPSVRPYRASFSDGSWLSKLRSRVSEGGGGSTANAPKGTGTSLNMDATKSNPLADESDDVRDNITTDRFPQVSSLKPFHPSDFINQYMLQQVPSASIAITHDGQWSALLQSGLLNPEEASQEDSLVTAIICNYTLTSHEGAVHLQSTAVNSAVEDGVITTSMSLEQCSQATSYTPPASQLLDGDPPVPSLDASQPIPRGVLIEPPPEGPSGRHVDSDRADMTCIPCKGSSPPYPPRTMTRQTLRSRSSPGIRVRQLVYLAATIVRSRPWQSGEEDEARPHGRFIPRGALEPPVLARQRM
ncbi:hypothetical protein HD554DRAFT_2329152 [Boletus coccyginus]|nr:hypothetical protein HD554DRAFT_2329152 [Boletus coccyginus]